MSTYNADSENDLHDPKRRRTTIEFWPVDDNRSAWKATEPDANNDLVGRGETAHEAVANYCVAVEPRDEVAFVCLDCDDHSDEMCRGEARQHTEVGHEVTAI